MGPVRLIRLNSGVGFWSFLHICFLNYGQFFMSQISSLDGFVSFLAWSLLSLVVSTSATG